MRYPHESMSHAEQLIPSTPLRSHAQEAAAQGSAWLLARWAVRLSLNAPTSALIATSTSTSTSTST
eukprot:SAG11_NODE_18284_length_495_cov_1.159091_1_plen_65_part_10